MSKVVNHFYPRSPCGERQPYLDNKPTQRAISIHALLAESDHQYLSQTFWRGYFYPRSPCGERLTNVVSSAGTMGISIHALLAESDSAKSTPEEAKRYFYPRSPCGERHMKMRVICAGMNFYPRSPCGERHQYLSQTFWRGYFYPRSPCGERLIALFDFPIVPAISIHALLAESDYLATWKSCDVCYFYPRSPCGERQRHQQTSSHPRNFYPRSPCGERPDRNADWVRVYVFLSTLSLRRATLTV